MNDKELIRDMLDKMSGNLDEDWQSIADRFGVGIHADTLRKAALGIKMADQAGVLCFDGKGASQSNQEELEELYKERCKLRDERTALNKRLRDTARLENKIEKIEDAIERISKVKYTSLQLENKKIDLAAPDKTNSMIAVVSDIHYGLKVDSGKKVEYDPAIASARMMEYAKRIIEEKDKCRCEVLTIVLLGDLISGNIHKNVQLQNTENVVDQLIGCSEMIADFVYVLSMRFEIVNVYGVAGNHSRLDIKDDALNDERLDNVVLWYLRTAMRGQDNVKVWTKNEIQFYKSTICEFPVGTSNNGVAVHGDYDEFSIAGLNKLTAYLGYTPAVVLLGHKHEFGCLSVIDTMMIRSGCLCGTGDAYTERNRLKCRPCQTIITIDKYDMVKDIIPVWL